MQFFDVVEPGTAEKEPGIAGKEPGAGKEQCDRHDCATTIVIETTDVRIQIYF